MHERKPASAGMWIVTSHLTSLPVMEKTELNHNNQTLNCYMQTNIHLITALTQLLQIVDHVIPSACEELSSPHLLSEINRTAHRAGNVATCWITALHSPCTTQCFYLTLHLHNICTKVIHSNRKKVIVSNTFNNIISQNALHAHPSV